MTRFAFILTLLLTIGLLAGCGSSGSNEEDDSSTFPPPPSRPNAVQVDSTDAGG